MKLKMILASVFLAMCAVWFAPIETFAQGAKLSVRQRTRSFMSGSYAYKFTDADFAGAPLWNQIDNEPPLSIIQALKAAREGLARFIINSEKWKLNAVTLESMGDNMWYYRVHFFCPDAGCRDVEERSFTAFVKMDGKIIEPKKVTVGD